MELTIGIPVYNGREVLQQCLSSIYQNIKNIDFKVFVCDDGSGDGTSEMVEKEFPQVKLLKNPQNFGVSKSMNRILKQVKGKYFLRLDADTKVLPGSVTGLIEFLNEHPNVGIVAPKLVGASGNFQRNFQEGLQKPIWWLGEYALWLSKLLHFAKHKVEKEHPEESIKVAVLGSAAILVRKEILEKVGWDENLPFFMEDADITMEIKKAGWDAWYYPMVAMEHLGGHSDEKIYIHCRDRSLQSLYFFTKKHFPGRLNQTVLTCSILIGSAISLILASLAFLPSRFHSRAKIIVDRAGRSFVNVFRWHWAKFKCQNPNDKSNPKSKVQKI